MHTAHSRPCRAARLSAIVDSRSHSARRSVAHRRRPARLRGASVPAVGLQVRRSDRTPPPRARVFSRATPPIDSLQLRSRSAAGNCNSTDHVPPGTRSTFQCPTSVGSEPAHTAPILTCEPGRVLVFATEHDRFDLGALGVDLGEPGLVARAQDRHDDVRVLAGDVLELERIGRDAKELEAPSAGFDGRLRHRPAARASTHSCARWCCATAPRARRCAIGRTAFVRATRARVRGARATGRDRRRSAASSVVKPAGSHERRCDVDVRRRRLDSAFPAGKTPGQRHQHGVRMPPS